MHVSLRVHDTNMTQTGKFLGLSQTQEVLLYTNSNTWRPFISELQYISSYLPFIYSVSNARSDGILSYNCTPNIPCI